MQVRLRNLDVVAEDTVVADLERADAGARPFPLFHLGDDTLPGSADRAQFVQLAIDAVTSEPAVARERRRIVDERRFDPAAHVGEVVEFGGDGAEQRRLDLGQQRVQPRHRRERLLQRRDVARTGGAQGGTGDKALQILHAPAGVPKPAAFGRARSQLLDRVEAITDRLEQGQGAQQPRSQQAAPHRRYRAIELREQRAVAAAVGPFHDLEMPEGGRIEEQRVGALAVRDGAHVRQVDLLTVAQILHQRAGGCRGGGTWLETEAVQAGGAKLCQQGAPRRLQLERPRLNRRNRHGTERDRRHRRAGR